MATPNTILLHYLRLIKLWFQNKTSQQQHINCCFTTDSHRLTLLKTVGYNLPWPISKSDAMAVTSDANHLWARPTIDLHQSSCRIVALAFLASGDTRVWPLLLITSAEPTRLCHQLRTCCVLERLLVYWIQKDRNNKQWRGYRLSLWSLNVVLKYVPASCVIYC
jgi:hypothetical protein